MNQSTRASGSGPGPGFSRRVMGSRSFSDVCFTLTAETQGEHVRKARSATVGAIRLCSNDEHSTRESGRGCNGTRHAGVGFARWEDHQGHPAAVGVEREPQYAVIALWHGIISVSYRG